GGRPARHGVVSRRLAVPARSADRRVLGADRAVHRGEVMMRRLLARIPFVAAAAFLVAGIASSQSRSPESSGNAPEAEFHMARMIYSTRGGGGSRGWRMPWWAIDYPEAEINFLPALERFTRLSVAKDSRHLELTDDRLFDYPWLFVQQVGQGYWTPTEAEAERLREYLLRGG